MQLDFFWLQTARAPSLAPLLEVGVTGGQLGQSDCEVVADT